jgi:hypothetical protein
VPPRILPGDDCETNAQEPVVVSVERSEDRILDVSDRLVRAGVQRDRADRSTL